MIDPRLDRRSAVRVILAAAAAAGPLSALAQARLRKIGVLWHAATAEDEAIYRAPLQEGFADIGYVEGRDYVLIETYAADKHERFDANAAELVAMKVDVIVAVTGPAADAAQRMTTTLPIVFLIVPDPVGRKFAQSLSRPGGNLTGQSTIATDLSQKRLELLKEAIPDLTRVGLFMNAKEPHMNQSSLERTRIAANARGVAVEVFPIADPLDLNMAFQNAERSGLKGAIFLQDPLFFNARARLAHLGLAHGVATMVANSVMVEDGCLMSYGPNFAEQFRRVATYVDKILRGQRPGDIPIEEPTRIRLVINLKTAAALNLNIPSTLFIRVDSVIE